MSSVWAAAARATDAAANRDAASYLAGVGCVRFRSVHAAHLFVFAHRISPDLPSERRWARALESDSMSKLAGECPHYLKQDTDTSQSRENRANLARIAPKPGGGRPTREGDWQCTRCGMHGFASREECLRCGGPRPPMRAELAAGSHAAWLLKQARRDDMVRPPPPKKVLVFLSRLQGSPLSRLLG